MVLTGEQIKRMGEIEALKDLLVNAIEEVFEEHLNSEWEFAELDSWTLGRELAHKLYGRIKLVEGPKDGSGNGEPEDGDVTLKEDLDRA